MKENDVLDFQAGEVLLLDKPYGWTSFDVVKKVRYAIKQKLNIKKIKVGHAGTLDPLATGLLVICTGRKTKEIQHYMNGTKEYTGTIFLGATRPSYDMETEINKTYDISNISKEDIEKVKEKLTGEYLQVPPIFSAKKIDGKRAYDLARKGEEMQMKKNLIHVHSFELTKVDLPNIEFKIVCSKGTYIRSIANDMGELLGVGAYLSELRRTKSGDHDVSQSIEVEQFVSMVSVM